METLTPSRRSIAALLSAPTDEDIGPIYSTRSLVDNAKDKGLIRAPGEAAPVEKNGIEVARKEGVRTQWMKVGPKRARLWLENNFVNRPVVQDVVDGYGREMKGGRWARTHQGIAFNDADDLIDGQHRLMAIVKYEVSIWLMVTFGLPKEVEGQPMTTMDAVDRGRPRSVADQLKIQHGYTNGREIAMICASLGFLCFSLRTRRLSVGETLRIYEEFRAPVDWVIEHRPKMHGLKQAGVLAAFAFAMATETNEQGPEITKLFLALTREEGLVEGSPIWMLRKFLTSDEAKLLTRGTHRGLAEVVLQAIHLQQTGRLVDRLDVSQEGAEHFRALQPERVATVAALFRLPEEVS